MRQPAYARAWAPGLTGVTEVLHARMVAHAYPMHTHETWTLLIVDDGAVRYDLERHERGAYRQVVTLLPPHVPHNGRDAVTFKRCQPARSSRSTTASLVWKRTAPLSDSIFAMRRVCPPARRSGLDKLALSGAIGRR